MTHHQHEVKENYEKLYYIASMLAGIFTGVVIGHGIGLIIGLGIFGLLFAGFFLQLLVRGREDK